ncbi:MAG: hypothetical protein EOO99_11525 [Pedobacter sp.]|nr:MAG: hypothetical protein EOO99_11525 [Pedobacter sp.]
MGFLLGEKIFPNVIDTFNFLYEYKENSNSLSVVLSPIKNKFILRGYDFKTNKLFVSEKFIAYYTYNHENLINYLVDLISKNNYHSVNLTGSSKGSFGAIILGISLSKKLKLLKILCKVRVVAFSPQTEIYPLNNNIIGLPSYKNLIKFAKNYNSIDWGLKTYGLIRKILDDIDKNFLSIFVIYGENHFHDKVEAQRLSCSSLIKLLPIPSYSFHTSIVLYTKKGEQLSKTLTNKIHTSNEDAAYLSPKNSNNLLKDFLLNVDKFNYDLNDLLLD